jgi:hypothetical protein
MVRHCGLLRYQQEGIMVFDEDNLLKVATVVAKYNSYHKGSDPADIVNRMKSIAYTEFGGNRRGGYVSTSGFMLTLFHVKWDDEKHIKASIDVCIYDALMAD